MRFTELEVEIRRNRIRSNETVGATSILISSVIVYIIWVNFPMMRTSKREWEMAIDMADAKVRNPWTNVARGFLSVSYGIGSPLTAVLELRNHTLSERFDLPPELIYIACGVQILCVIGLFLRPTASIVALVLTGVTFGAIGSHLRIGSIITTLPAVFYSAIQIWFALKVRQKTNSRQ